MPPSHLKIDLIFNQHLRSLVIDENIIIVDSTFDHLLDCFIVILKLIQCSPGFLPGSFWIDIIQETVINIIFICKSKLLSICQSYSSGLSFRFIGKRWSICWLEIPFHLSLDFLYFIIAISETIASVYFSVGARILNRFSMHSLYLFGRLVLNLMLFGVLVILDDLYSLLNIFVFFIFLNQHILTCLLDWTLRLLITRGFIWANLEVTYVILVKLWWLQGISTNYSKVFIDELLSRIEWIFFILNY